MRIQIPHSGAQTTLAHLQQFTVNWNLEVRVHYFNQSENVYHNNLQGINIVKL